jgi:hypothetical protein
MAMETVVRHLQKGEWDQAHAIVQDDESRLGCWAHGIVHMLEGDISNARYWYRRADREYPTKVDIDMEVAALASALKESPQ